MNFANNMVRKLVSLVVLSVILLIVVQAIILSTVGTLGPEISNTRSEIEQLKLQNELKRAEIKEETTEAKLLPEIVSELQMKNKAITRVEISEDAYAQL